MSDSFLGQTILRKPTIIQTVKNERVVVRELAAPGIPGPQGPPGTIDLVVDGGSPSTNYGAVPVIDGGNP